MTDEQVLTATLWPRPAKWSNFLEVWNIVPLIRYMWNTLQVAGGATLGTVLSCVPVAYALARMRWRGRELVFLVVISTVVLPGVVTLVPIYVIFARLDWIPSFKPLIVPSFFAIDAFSIFLLRQFFMSIPRELSEAARVDGASEWKIMMQIIVPLARPAIGAVALFSFLYWWNEFFYPLLYLGTDRELWTLSLGLSEFRGLHNVDWNLIMAASVTFMLPVIIIFILAQKVFMEGIRLSVGK